MKDLHHPLISSTTEDRGDKSIGKTIEKATPSTQNVDAATIKRNPKVDAQLVSDFYRLVDASKGVIRGAQGANYRLSHPLGSNDVPPELNQIGKSLSKIKE